MGNRQQQEPGKGLAGEMPLLVVLSSVAQEAEPVRQAWDGLGEDMWDAWRHLSEWEVLSERCFGEPLGGHLLVLWALYTFGSAGNGGDTASPLILNELVDDNAEPRFGDEIVEDIVRIAFALGASWCASLGRRHDLASAAGAPGSPLVLRALDAVRAVSGQSERPQE